MLGTPPWERLTSPNGPDGQEDTACLYAIEVDRIRRENLAQVRRTDSRCPQNSAVTFINKLRAVCHSAITRTPEMAAVLVYLGEVARNLLVHVTHLITFWIMRLPKILFRSGASVSRRLRQSSR